jgi:hypothetical protein
MKVRRLKSIVCGCALALSWATRAFATPEFPDAVAKDLGLSSITVDPPQGCMLCHPTDAGGTSLRPFGKLLQQYGLVPYNESSLKQALLALEQNEPQLVDDIRAGRDPNEDPRAAIVHAPAYGCAVVPLGVPAGLAPGALLLVLGLLVLRRRAPPQLIESETRV